MNAISQSIQQGGDKSINEFETCFDKEDMPAVYQTSKAANRNSRLFYRKSLKEKTVHGQDLTQDNDGAIKTNSSYINPDSERAITESTLMERRPDDTLPSLPTPEDIHPPQPDDKLYDVPDFADNSEYELPPLSPQDDYEILPGTICHPTTTTQPTKNEIGEVENKLHSTDTLIEAEPPPIPPKLRTRQSMTYQNFASHNSTYQNSDDDDEHYVPVTAPSGLSISQASVDSGAEGAVSLIHSNSLSSDEYVLNTSMPSITFTQTYSSNEESPYSSLLSDDDMDNSRLQPDCLSLGNLSSLEVTSPCVPRAMPSIEKYLHYLYQSSTSHTFKQGLSPLHSDDGSDYSDCDSTVDREEANISSTISERLPQSDPNNIHVSNPGSRSADTSTNVSTLSHLGDSGLHMYDRLQHKNWRQLQSMGNKPSTDFTLGQPPRQRQVQSCVQGQNYPQESISRSLQRSTTSNAAEFSLDSQFKRDPVEMQTYMLQKMQQALEAIQAAYAYMPYMSSEAETPAVKTQTKSHPEILERSDNAKLGSEDSDIVSKPKGSSSPKQVGTMLQVSESQALMKNCLSEFNIK